MSKSPLLVSFFPLLTYFFPHIPLLPRQTIAAAGGARSVSARALMEHVCGCGWFRCVFVCVCVCVCVLHVRVWVYPQCYTKSSSTKPAQHSALVTSALACIRGQEKEEAEVEEEA